MATLRILFFLLILTSSVYAASSEEQNDSEAIQEIDIKEQERLAKIAELDTRYKRITQSIDETKNTWLHAYSNFETSKSLNAQLNDLNNQIANLKRKRKTKANKEELSVLEKQKEIILSQLALIPNIGERPFDELLSMHELPEPPTVSNPFAIFTGLSYNKHLEQLKGNYIDKIDQLKSVIVLLENERDILAQLFKLSEGVEYDKLFSDSQAKLERFKNALQILNSTAAVYAKRVDNLIFKTNYQIQEQVKNLLNLALIIFILFVVAFLIKFIIRKYIKDHERFYMANKIVNFANVVIIILVLFIRYIDNIGYLATVLGFASAGIAIAMRDWFMSILGWTVIVLGGSIHVGDRVKFQKDGMEYVGDVLDISLFRITLMEDVTLTTYMVNRRAGRIIFIPNNYIFTSMIANYSHNSLKTVWDGIDITITFTSNHKKAAYLAKEIARKFSKGYTDITRKQLNKLRDRYSLKNTNVEPRVFTFAEANGVRVSTWYLTNAYATLTLRSTISAEIIDAFNKEEDITIAYPTQTIHSASNLKAPPMEEMSEPV